jgi:hypothetical protein
MPCTLKRANRQAQPTKAQATDPAHTPTRNLHGDSADAPGGAKTALQADHISEGVKYAKLGVRTCHARDSSIKGIENNCDADGWRD